MTDEPVLLDALPVAIATLYPDARIKWANAHLGEILGIAPSELVGRRCDEVGMADQSKDEFEEVLRYCLESGSPQRFVNPVRLQGQSRIVAYRLRPLPDQGLVVGVAMTVEDTMVLTQLHDQLRDNERHALLAMFVGDALHDIGSDLLRLQIVLEESQVAGPDGRVGRLTTEALDLAERAHAKLRDAYSAVRSESSDEIRADLTDVIQKAWAERSPVVAPGHNRPIRHQTVAPLDAGPFWVRGDARTWVSVIGRLIRMSSLAVPVEVRFHLGFVQDPAGLPAGRYVELVISDDGDAGRRRRADYTRCQSTVRRHGGRLARGRSGDVVGSRFRLVLPAAQVMADEA